MADKFEKTSKFLSYVLRHQPASIGISLDSEGWAEVAALVAGAASAGKVLDLDLIRQVVATSGKKRFAISEDGLRIRAVQGHSVATVDRRFPEKTPPPTLFHGTTTRFVESIRREGLHPGARQYVHLTQDPVSATAVGQRRGAPVVLKIEALKMHNEGFQFFLAENGVWLTRMVPPEFLLE